MSPIPSPNLDPALALAFALAPLTLGGGLLVAFCAHLPAQARRLAKVFSGSPSRCVPGRCAFGALETRQHLDTNMPPPAAFWKAAAGLFGRAKEDPLGLGRVVSVFRRVCRGDGGGKSWLLADERSAKKR